MAIGKISSRIASQNKLIFGSRHYFASREQNRMDLGGMALVRATRRRQMMGTMMTLLVWLLAALVALVMVLLLSVADHIRSICLLQYHRSMAQHSPSQPAASILYVQLDPRSSGSTGWVVARWKSS